MTDYLEKFRDRLRKDWNDTRPIYQGICILVWAVTALGLVWLIPRSIVPLRPIVTYQLQILVTALFVGAFAEPLMTFLEYESIEKWEEGVQCSGHTNNGQGVTDD